MVLAYTLATEPQDGDRITLEGETFTIYSQGSRKPGVATDPTKSVWELKCSK